MCRIFLNYIRIYPITQKLYDAVSIARDEVERVKRMFSEIEDKIGASSNNTIKEIKEEIKQRNFKIEFSQDLEDRVKEAIINKKLICNK